MTFSKIIFGIVTFIATVLGVILGGVEVYKLIKVKESNIEIWAHTAGATAELYCRDHRCGYGTNISIDIINTGESSLVYRSLGQSEGAWVSDTCFARVYVVGSTTEITANGIVIDNGGEIPISASNKYSLRHFHRLDNEVYDQLFKDLGPKPLSLFKLNMALAKLAHEAHELEIININQPFQKHEFFIVPMDSDKPEISGVYEMNALGSTLLYKQSSEPIELRSCNWNKPVSY